MLMNNIEIRSILNGSYLYMFIIPVIAIIGLIILINMNLRKSLRGIGSVLFVAGALTLGITYIIPSILNILSAEIGAYMSIINSILDNFMQKLMFAGLLEGIAGLILVITSVILKKDKVYEEKV